MAANPLIKKYGTGNPKIAVVACLHGDEPCGLVVEKLLKRTNLKNTVYFIIANPVALKAKKRFIKTDMNRIFPGKANGNTEEQLAYNISYILKKSDFVLDIHSTDKESPVFAITTADSMKHREFVKYLQAKKYVIMANEVANKKSLIDYVNQNNGLGISIECGQKHTKKSRENAIAITKNFLKFANITDGKNKNKNFKLEMYKVEKFLRNPSSDFIPAKLKDFKLIKTKQFLGKGKHYEMRAIENFYPIGFSPPSKKMENQFFCFVGKKIN